MCLKHAHFDEDAGEAAALQDLHVQSLLGEGAPSFSPGMAKGR